MTLKKEGGGGGKGVSQCQMLNNAEVEAQQKLRV